MGTDHCVNVANAHDKGHQNAKGKIISTGPFTSSFISEEFYPVWRDIIEKAITQIHTALLGLLERGPRDASEESLVLKLHTPLMKRFYDNVLSNHRRRGASAELIRCHSTCFCCLMQAPQHPLPCGHVLCTSCIESYGRPLNGNRNFLQMDYCPLHRLNTQWRKPCLIRFKPLHAGVRVLCLDGYVVFSSARPDEAD